MIHCTDTKLLPVVNCLNCHGSGCTICDHKGYIRLEDDDISPEIQKLFRSIDSYTKEEREAIASASVTASITHAPLSDLNSKTQLWLVFQIAKGNFRFVDKSIEVIDK